MRQGDVEERYQPCGTATDPCDPQVRNHPCAEVTVQRDRGFGVPHLRRRPRGRDVRRRLRGRRGPPVPDRRPAPRRSGRAVGVHRRLRGQPCDGPRAVGHRALHRARPAAPDRPVRQPLRKAGREAQARPDRVRRGAQPVRLRGPPRRPRCRASTSSCSGPRTRRPVRPTKKTDVVAIASLVGGIFGKGGGAEIESGPVPPGARGPSRGHGARRRRRLRGLRSAEDPEAPTTIFDGVPPTRSRRPAPDPDSLAIPDEGSVRRPTSSKSSGDDFSAAEANNGFFGNTAQARGVGSNALLVSGSETESGHPIAVFGPQTGLLLPAAPDGDGHLVGHRRPRGVAFAGTNLYVSSAAASTTRGAPPPPARTMWTPSRSTSANGGPVASGLPRLRLPREVPAVRGVEAAKPSPPTPPIPARPASRVLRVNQDQARPRTARATIEGDPVSTCRCARPTCTRSTRRAVWPTSTTPTRSRTPRTTSAPRTRSATRSTGSTPTPRTSLTTTPARTPSARTASTTTSRSGPAPTPTPTCEFEWEGYQPIRDGELTGNRADYTPFSEHPQVINQRYITSWNNKRAPAFRASDANFSYHSLYRSIPLDEGIEARTEGGEKISPAELIDVMEAPGTVDYAATVLPCLLEDARLRDDRGRLPRACLATRRRKARRRRPGSEKPCPEEGFRDRGRQAGASGLVRGRRAPARPRPGSTPTITPARSS